MRSKNQSINIDPKVYQCLAEATFSSPLGFGSQKLPIMYKAVCRNSVWEERELIPYQALQIDPAAKVLHYSQEVFEGMKAYGRTDGLPRLFRPELNAERLALSAKRLCMPAVPKDIFMEGVDAICSLARDLIPTEPGQSLYIRPFLIGVDPNLSLTPATVNEFYVIASPSQIYHQGTMKVLIEMDECRASLGGTGAVKVGGNYAAAQASSQRAMECGYDQTLWLDPVERRYLEELSGMNVFAVINGELHTPALSGSILPGITRASLITLAGHLGLTVRERRIDIHELLSLIQSGQCSELFACGTAAVLSPITALGSPDRLLAELPVDGPIASQLREALTAIQEGRQEDCFNWMRPVRAIHAREDLSAFAT